MKQTIRIIGGRYRGKKLSFPAVEHLRPTPDRVKETLFNWLMHKINGARCLDAFAGSGSLGFEAFSRGASEVVMVESSTAAFDSLIRIAQSFQAPELKIIHADVRKYLELPQAPYDIIFLDPPFSGMLLQEFLQQLRIKNLVAADGVIYTESPAPLLLDTDTFQLLKAKQAGQVHYALYGSIT